MAKVDINILGESIGKLADAFSEGIKALSKWVGSSNMRRMAKCIRVGDKIVGRLDELNIEDKELSKLMDKWDKYNN